MLRRSIANLIIVGLGLGLWLGRPGTTSAQSQAYNLSAFYYYPYYYFPHNYWPTMSPRWPEPPGAPYQRPPAYMAYPAFREPNWRYDLWHSQKYYRGFHFWLDQF
jgi:hypothetical protein